MKILIVCRWHGDHAAAFIMEQVDALRSLGHDVQYVTAKKGGIGGYVELYRNIRKAIRDVQPDIVHAHYGICGLIANLQRQVPVVVTYPGSDINDKKIRPISVMAMRLSKYNLFMSKRQIAKVKRYAKPEKTEIVRYGILSDLFVVQDKATARKAMGLDADKKYVLFSSKFTRKDKDPELAKQAVALLNDGNDGNDANEVELLPLTGGYTKEEMVILMNAVDAAIVTSKSEGSPQFTKEVMACGCPIVSVDVGDVAEQVEGLDGCFIVKSREPREIAEALEKAIAFGKTKGHQHIKSMRLDNVQVAERLVEIYNKVIV
ncbi:MAG: glycosyltransferase [Paludibacteraceae bacterium]|nr:glycosyltransferase [Paludibacteraceae bacterium]